MRVWTLIATIVVASVTASSAMAQNQAAAKTQQMPIAVVDVGHILKNHPTMKSDMEAIQSQMEAADKQMAAKRDAIMKQMEELREQYTEGTPEYDKAEKRIAEQDTAFRLELVKKRKQFETAQANLLYRVHNEISSLVKYASDQMGTQLVIRVNRQKMDPKKPETVQLVMSQDVLYFSEKIDLTNWVLDALKARSGNQAARSSGAATR